MPSNRPTPRRTLAALMLLIIAVNVLPAIASAETIPLQDSDYIQTYYVNDDNYGTLTLNPLSIFFNKIEDYPSLTFAFVETPKGTNQWDSYLIARPSDSTHVQLKDGSTVIGDGTLHLTVNFEDNTPKSIQFWIEVDNWDIGSRAGSKTIAVIPEEEDFLLYLSGRGTRDKVDADHPVMFRTSAYVGYGIYGHQIFRSNYEWFNELVITDTEIMLNRNLNYSQFVINTDNGVFSDNSSNNVMFPNAGSGSWTVINSMGREFTGLIGGGGTLGAPVTVYVQSSQTGAILADAHIEIQDTTTEPWTEVVNQTLPSGQVTISLPKDTGIHFTQYRIGATVPGYQQVVPALFFRVTGPTNVVVKMEPTSGGPVNENNTFLEFYVRDISANAIANANVKVDGQLRWTNAQGYTQFEVPKNASYPYSVSKSGYITIEGRATVADGPRYVVNVVLGPGTVPTYTPTIGPGETPTAPGATPTPDTRTNEQKGQAIIDLIADFAEPIAILAILATIFGLMKMMTPGRR